MFLYCIMFYNEKITTEWNTQKYTNTNTKTYRLIRVNEEQVKYAWKPINQQTQPRTAHRRVEIIVDDCGARYTALKSFDDHSYSQDNQQCQSPLDEEGDKTHAFEDNT